MYEDEQCGAVPRGNPQVSSEVNRFDNLATELHEVITILDKQLTPVLTPTEGPLDCVAAERETLVELAQSLREKCDRVESAINRIRTISSHLEL